MGRSSSTTGGGCLKMIACGTHTAADDDPHTPPLTKASSDKRGWSLRKRSGRHRVIGNNCSSETAAFADKEVPQASTTELQAPVKSNTPDEKPGLPKPVVKFSQAPASQYDGESTPSMEVVAPENDCSAGCEMPKVSPIMVASDNDSDSTSSESKMANVVCVPNTGCSKLSADPDLTTESVVLEVESDKMAESGTSDSEVTSEDGSDTSLIVDEAVAIVIQAAIRGFLAQKGFRQLRSAVKLQALVRGYLVRRNAVETLHCIRGIVKVQALVRARSSKSLDQHYKPTGGQFSTAKLLKNSFARQLLKSTRKPETLSIRCDPLNPNSAWGWLEKWMSVSACEFLENEEPSSKLEDDDHILPNVAEAEAELSSTPLSESIHSNSVGDDRTFSPESEESTFNQVVDTVDHQSSLPVFVEQQAHAQMAEVFDEDVNPIKMDARPAEVSGLQAEFVSFSHETAEILQPKLSAKRLVSEELNGEGKKISYGSRMPSNPVFIATLSNFEELTSAVNSVKSIISSHQEGAKANVDTYSALEGSVDKTSDVGVVLPSNAHILVASSECGTELSISSTLDSPDRCEPQNAHHPEPKTKAVETSFDREEGLNHEVSCTLSNHISDSTSQTAQGEEVHAVNGITESLVVVEASPQVEQKAEIDGSNAEIDLNSSPTGHKHDLSGHDMPIEHYSAIGQQADKFSSAASPNSHMTVSESQGTPSSQVSVKSTKRSSLSAGKKTLNPKFDLGVRISVDHLPKDHKSGKRRNSFGSTKSDNPDQEPRDSSSDIALPSYMQATKSARAKVQSPRSSPEFHDKEVNSKKRHSLPGTGGRQGSPRVQRSTSQGVNANGSNPSNERKWQR